MRFVQEYVQQKINVCGKCIKGIKGDPVQINHLERFVNDWAIENDVSYKINKADNKNKKVAIIGTGPAGIACASELIKKGYYITMYEKEYKARRSIGIWYTRF